MDFSLEKEFRLPPPGRINKDVPLSKDVDISIVCQTNYFSSPHIQLLLAFDSDGPEPGCMEYPACLPDGGSKVEPQHAGQHRLQGALAGAAGCRPGDTRIYKDM